MSAYIVVHKATKEESTQASDYLYESLSKLYPGKVDHHYNGSLITIGNGIHIDFRCGVDHGKLAGLICNYYYTEDNGLVADMLEMCACKRNGKRLTNLDQVVQIVYFYMKMFDEIDAWLEEED